VKIVTVEVVEKVVVVVPPFQRKVFVVKGVVKVV
jgi:hypothetical protein